MCGNVIGELVAFLLLVFHELHVLVKVLGDHLGVSEFQLGEGCFVVGEGAVVGVVGFVGECVGLEGEGVVPGAFGVKVGVVALVPVDICL